jgi:capsular exopolysaccharide synthesis family protein
VEPIEYLRAIRRRWLVVACSTLAFAGGAWTTTAFAAQTADVASYQSTAVLLRTGGSLSLNTMTALIGLRPVATRVADVIGFEGDPVELVSRIGAEFDGETGILFITATEDSREDARTLANAYARSLIDYIDEGFVGESANRLSRRIVELQVEIQDLDARLAATPPGPAETALLQQRVERNAMLELLIASHREAVAARLGGAGLVFLQPAPLGSPIASEDIQVLPTSPPARLALGAILGLAVGIALALVIERFDTRIRTREAAEEHFQLPVLAEIPLIPRASRAGVVAATDPSSPSGEAFGLLGAEMMREPIVHVEGNGDMASRGQPPQTILVTSAGHAEGKTTVVANLAVALSEMGKRVLVVSCDFRRPAIHRLFGIPNLEGLAQALEVESGNGKPVLEGHILTTRFPAIWVVPSGPASKRPGELLSSGGMRRALSEARSAADVILLDAAPILAGSDATHLLADADAVLMVARSGSTTSELAQRASAVLRRMRAPVVGVALNVADAPVAPKGVRPS